LTILPYLTGWIKKGKEKDIFTNSGRKRVNIFGSVDITNQNVLAPSYKIINKFSVCDFLKALNREASHWEKIILS
jgi:hypothetical protein